MKTIDFTHAGGFPLTQEGLDYLQTAYTECLNVFASMGASGSAPIIISGMEMTVPGAGEVAVTDGWFFYNGELVKFTGSTQFVGIGGTVALVVIAASASSLTYNDGSVYPAIKDKGATLTCALPVTDATHFPYSAMQQFQVAFGANGREVVWNTLAVSTDPTVGGVTGTVYYKKNLLTNTLQIRGVLTASNAQNFAASPYASYYSMCTLPAGYVPGNNTYFGTQYFLATQIKDDMGVAWIKEVNAGINSSGVISLNWIKPESGVSVYGVLFNVIVPLD